MKPSKSVKILILLLILLSTMGISSADVINPGEKNVPFSYQISNIQDYPDYVFILHGTPNPSIEVLNSSEFSFYKLSTCSIYAVPRNVYNEVQIDQMDETQMSEFLKNDSRVARSSLKLEGTYGNVNEANPLETALIILNIKSIQGNNLDIQKEKIIYGYNNGLKVEKPFQSQNQTPEPTSPGPSWDYYIYFIVLPIIALGIIVFIIIRRKTS
ncbi:hypothetical protein BK008_11860 [Methanobacterium sp. MZ-A1]|nr:MULTISPECIES: hypothetical protein [Methanobacterium]AUB58942.1 hypothetical protein BK008_11860 [Methanobacterium sp. MZ-A1]MBW4257636.1 hypothetical protein [Methanobacterium sp. YSL]PKL73795.1 MAG: hypothetical protein CVV29_01610 [Methanobacteriales archaeon HGW-Methanobacteriales-2]